MRSPGPFDMPGSVGSERCNWTMPKSVTCPECGSEISGDTGLNLCLQCLLRIGLGAQPEPKETDTEPCKATIESEAKRFEDEALSPEQIGDAIDHFRLLQVIGEGGFGIVYKAEQQSPVRRLVALKIIKLGMDTRQLVARFETERQ